MLQILDQTMHATVGTTKAAVRRPVDFAPALTLSRSVLGT